MTARTLYRRIVDAHTVRSLGDGGQVLLYVDRQVLNEYTSPQAFAALHAAGRTVWRPASTIAVVDHVNPTTPERNAKTMVIADAGRALQVRLLAGNCARHGIALSFGIGSSEIEHRLATQTLMMPRRSRPWSPGAPAPTRVRPSLRRCRIPRTSPTRRSGAARRARWSTWVCSRGSRWTGWRSAMPSSAPAMAREIRDFEAAYLRARPWQG